MIKDSNKRIQITLTKKQHQWLTKFCKKKKITPSTYIRWILVMKAEEMLTLLRISPSERSARMEDLMAIIQAKWID